MTKSFARKPGARMVRAPMTAEQKAEYSFDGNDPEDQVVVFESEEEARIEDIKVCARIEAELGLTRDKDGNIIRMKSGEIVFPAKV